MSDEVRQTNLTKPFHMTPEGLADLQKDKDNAGKPGYVFSASVKDTLRRMTDAQFQEIMFEEAARRGLLIPGEQ